MRWGPSWGHKAKSAGGLTLVIQEGKKQTNYISEVIPKELMLLQVVLIQIWQQKKISVKPQKLSFIQVTNLINVIFHTDEEELLMGRSQLTLQNSSVNAGMINEDFKRAILTL